MALHYELKGIANWEEVCKTPDGKMNPDTEFLIFATMAVGIGHITTDNWGEFAARLKLASMTATRPYDIPEPSVIKAHVGLRTNVSPETRAKFTKRMMDNFYHEQSYALRDL